MKRKKTEDLNSQIHVEKMNVAYHLISKGFPDVIRDTYLRGKTEFRDFLYDKMGCSLLEAEILVDALEKDGKIEFRRFRKGMRYGTWIIHKNSMMVSQLRILGRRKHFTEASNRYKVEIENSKKGGKEDVTT